MEAGGVVGGVTRVLLVDDSPVDRRVAQLLLSSNPCAGSFNVIAVDSAKKAMEFLGLKDGEEQGIDMVLTDYSMPEMTGYDLLKAIKCFPGAESPEADTGDRHVVRERAPADQQMLESWRRGLHREAPAEQGRAAPPELLVLHREAQGHNAM